MSNNRWRRVPELDYKDGEFGWIYYGWVDRKFSRQLFTMGYGQDLIQDPNQAILHDDLFLLFTDQAEYYAVCADCHANNISHQWTGCTTSPGWQETSETWLEFRKKNRPWCQFCDPVFGNGGWVLLERDGYE